MIKFKYILIFVSCLLIFNINFSFAATDINIRCKANTAFSPKGEGESLIVSAINSAQKSILVQAYGFTNTTILNAMISAKQRGVNVQIILDKSNDTLVHDKLLKPFVDVGVPIWIDNKVAIAHNKVMIIDDVNLITGSFNFTASAQLRNAENVLYVKGCSTLAKEYINNWNNRQKVSAPYALH